MTREQILSIAKPILFNTEMVKATLDGRKTTFRKPIKAISRNACGFTIVSRNDGKGNYVFEEVYDTDENDRVFKNPQNRIRVGDYLYVKEAWQNVFETEYDREADGYCVNIRTMISNFEEIPKTNLGLSKECSCQAMKEREKYCVYLASDISYTDEKLELRWQRSANMPKEASRIFLKVTDVRVERLQDITYEQCRKEGIHSTVEWAYKKVPLMCTEIEKNNFEVLWNLTINKKDLDKFGWDANPWVWVIEFERVEVD